MRVQKAMIFLLVAVLAVGLCACGRHDSRSYGFKDAGDTKIIEKDQSIEARMAEAVASGDPARVDAILGEGFPVDGSLKNGRTPLIEAVVWAHAELVEFLLTKGADPEAKDAEGLTALDHADGDDALMRLLVPKTDDEQAALFAAVAENRYNDVKDMLIEGVDPNVHDGDGETPLTLAIALGHEFVVRILIQPTTATDIDLANRQGETPLRMALRLERTRIAQMLRQRGAQE